MEKTEFSPGNIVESLKGHDTGKKYLIIGIAGKDFVLIADGKSRTADKPKLKRSKHLRLLSEGEPDCAAVNNIDNSVVVNILRKFEGGFYA